MIAKQIHRDGNVLQFSRRQFFEARFERAANLPIDIHRNTNAACTRQMLMREAMLTPSPSVTVSMNDITNVTADSDPRA